MASQPRSLVGSLQNEEYTGENRCIPCTIVNVGIALVLGALAAVRSRGAAAVIVAVSFVAIYLRGYLVPGTPQLTKRFLPGWVLQYFDHHPLEDDFTRTDTAGYTETTVETDTTGEKTATEESFETVEKIRKQREEAVDPEQFLLEVGVTTQTETGNDLRLTESFAAAVDEELAAIDGGRPERAAVGDVFDAEPDEVEFKDREYPAIKVGRRIRKWPSEGALQVDVATHRALEERTDRWRSVPLEQRIGILESLRTFQLQCPVCDGEVAFGDAVVESCCATYEVISYECLDCGERLLELDPATIDEGDGTGIRP
ncbi:hypothetical protein AArcSl_2060 [Halalkaliarchaeum desulfuricum]|uniref:Uncharacterized protein n=1 Tax=Halalkaliarchaeum desulfuricum TaxID=2055893 RepID=A0A343TKR3_9EURY|nr:hypothetical protein [Halalkaliarchaeum desulfuricum]AUX09685.1 hypothetical protein AArcSl_2060 [Halalkaliarchaeum desulfuricum]